MRTVVSRLPTLGVMPQLFGPKLQCARRQQKLTQDALAQLLRLSSYEYISRLERQQQDPSLDLVVRVALVFDLPIDYFLQDSIAVEDMSSAALRALPEESSFAQSFGPKLQFLRQERKWGQTQLSRALGLARRSYISNLETGRKMPSIDLVIRIANLFDVTTDYLLQDAIPIKVSVSSSDPNSR